jgi:catechol 2,3-dioxygenase
MSTIAATTGAVALTVADLDRAERFYEQVIGLKPLGRDGDVVRLGAADDTPLVELHGDPDAPPAPDRATGLFHLAVLVPSRPELARAIRRVVDGGWRFTGASNHIVSEAMYLNDPEGNGIEIYRDQPRAEWDWDGGELRMATLALDVDAIMREEPQDADAGMPAGTTMGHVHLKVADIGATEGFYGGMLGMEVTVRAYPGALFLSTGGYHHHIGANTWAGENAPTPAPGTRGLRSYELLLPDAGAVAELAGRLDAGDVRVEDRGDGVMTAADPSGNVLRLTPRAQAGTPA